MVPRTEPAVAPRTTVIERSNLSGLLVRLDVDGSKYLFLRLNRDGDIQRLGTADRSTLSGTTNPDVFARLIQKMSPSLLRWAGQSWSDPAPKGKLCLLVVGFRQSDGQEVAMQWMYGSESHEPPSEVLEFVVSAVEATNPWFGEMKLLERTRRRERSAKGWHLVPLMPA
jgi:hypothetical protein